MRVHPGATGRPALQCLLLGHDETTAGGCARLGCQTTGLDVDLEIAALAFILELSEVEPSGGPDEYGLTVEALVVRAGGFLREHGLER